MHFHVMNIENPLNSCSVFCDKFLIKAIIGYDPEQLTIGYVHVGFHQFNIRQRWTHSAHRQPNVPLTWFGYSILQAIRLDPTPLRVVITAFNRHLWHSTRKCALFSIYSNRVPETGYQQIAKHFVTNKMTKEVHSRR